MAAMAPNEQPLPKVGLRHTLRFQVTTEEEEVLSRAVFCKKVIIGQLQLKVEEVYCIQWNQQDKAFDVTLRTEDIYRRVAKVCQTASGVRPLAFYKVLNLDKPNFRTITIHMFNPFVTDLALAIFLKQYGEVMSAARYINDPLGFWTGRRQFQVLLNPDPEGPGGFKHPPAIFSLGGDRGYLYYSRQPAFCRRCRQSGHTESACDGACCRFCGQAGHEAKNCVAPKACHGCGGLDHLYRSCPSRRRTFADVVKPSGVLERAKEPEKGPGHTGQIQVRPVQTGTGAGLSGSGVEAVLRGQGTTTAAGAEAPLVNRERVVPAPTPGPVSSMAKEGARSGSQVFDIGGTTESGESGRSKKVRREGKWKEGQSNETRVDGVSGGSVEQQKRAAEVVEEGGETGQVVGGEVVEQTAGESAIFSSAGVGLGFDLSQELLSPPFPLGENVFDGISGQSSLQNPVPFSWAEEMDRVDLYP